MTGNTTTPDSYPQRIQLSRAKGWRKPEGAIVVSRPSRWGNFYTVRTAAELCYRNQRYIDSLVDPTAILVARMDKHGHSQQAWGGFDDRSTATLFAVDLYRRSLEATYLQLDGPLNRNWYLGELAGHDLACWCPLDQPCHADVLLQLANPLRKAKVG